MKTSRRRFKIEGRIKGDIFRPFILRLAHTFGIAGFVKDEEGAVVIEAEGENLTKFQKMLLEAPPPSVVIERITDEIIPALGDTIFRITGSEMLEGVMPTIPLDTAICKNCLQECLKPDDRRYYYPFISCSNCGPKYSLSLGIPFDRHNSLFSDLTMCKSCRMEYNDPLNRRFHHHTNSCSKCGPKIWLVTPEMNHDCPFAPEEFISYQELVESAKELISSGEILAIKGWYGLNLVCDATNDKAVSVLLNQRRNLHYPIPILMHNTGQVSNHFAASEHEIEILMMNDHPCVLLPFKRKESGLSDELLKRKGGLCVVLPVSALDYLLSQGMPPLLLTSASSVDEPICKKNEEAYEMFSGITKYYIFHNLPLITSSVSTVVRSLQQKPYYLRRGRGTTPLTINLEIELPKRILAVGGDNHNSFCLARKKEAIISPYHGYLQNHSSFKAFEEGIYRFMNLFRFTPDIVLYDIHPDYVSSIWSERQRFPHGKIQHHHAHFAACLAENNCYEEVLGIILDGGGYGLDGTLWGGEFFQGSIKAGFKRTGCINHFFIPGNDISSREPWRVTVSLLRKMFGQAWRESAPERYISKLGSLKVDVVEDMLDSGFNCRSSSACGRFLDGAASLAMGITESEYSSQPAVEFEALLRKKYLKISPDDLENPPYQHHIDESPLSILNLDGLIRGIVTDLQAKVTTSEISRRFHVSLASAIAEMGVMLARKYHNDTIALSGGVFQNMHLLNWIKQSIESKGLRVLIHNTLPPGDQNLCLGQAVLASRIEV